MNIEQEKFMHMLAYESFIRRASEVNMPFMLKGSYVTRQYFSNPADREPGDLDWLYMEKLHDVERSRAVFNDWATQVTELKTEDGVAFKSFTENAFWRSIDYAMHNDFPTVNTDLSCFIDGEELPNLFLDISFNLPVEFPPVPLLYRPLRGEPFTIPYTAPLCLQVSWKIHQTLVRPRFKDLFDLIHLLRHPSFTPETLDQSLKALVRECNADSVALYRFQYFLQGDLDRLFDGSISAIWDYWRHQIDSRVRQYYETAEDITEAAKLPYNLSEFLSIFYTALIHAGFKPGLADALFDVWNNKSGYQKQESVLEENMVLIKLKMKEEDRRHEPVSEQDAPQAEAGGPGTAPELREGWLVRLKRFFRS